MDEFPIVATILIAFFLFCRNNILIVKKKKKSLNFVSPSILIQIHIINSVINKLLYLSTGMRMANDLKQLLFGWFETFIIRIEIYIRARVEREEEDKGDGCFEKVRKGHSKFPVRSLWNHPKQTTTLHYFFLFFP